jgi:hypothetical protein
MQEKIGTRLGGLEGSGLVPADEHEIATNWLIGDGDRRRKPVVYKYIGSLFNGSLDSNEDLHYAAFFFTTLSALLYDHKTIVENPPILKLKSTSYFPYKLEP